MRRRETISMPPPPPPVPPHLSVRSRGEIETTHVPVPSLLSVVHMRRMTPQSTLASRAHSNGGFCAAAFAVVKGRPEALQVLAELGADLHATDKHHQTVRQLALKKRDLKCLAILDKYAPVDNQDEGSGNANVNNGTFTLSGWV